ncbi:hypothetical protein [Pseudoramibacter faecis]|uniref:hypothetical protein n=1 Tax=Pseudoramibacter faecis TaxID=3108534 RepID=UPI002E7A73B1|nr:hypothetical protein [Pseudoramibacter sp. HA2172]
MDRTTKVATVSNSTAVVMSKVKDDTGAIGYISLDSMDKSVKAVKVDGAAPSVKTVKDGSYHLFRPFNIVTKGNLNAPAKDFIAFGLSIVKHGAMMHRIRIEVTSTVGKGSRFVIHFPDYS